MRIDPRGCPRDCAFHDHHRGQSDRDVEHPARGVPLRADATGAFTWTYRASAGDSVSVRFNVRGVKSEPIEP